MATTADWSRAVTVTDAEFLAGWQAFGLGEPPLDLGLEPCLLPGATAADRRALLDQALHRLHAARALDGQGRLAAVLRPLATPRWTCDLRVGERAGPWTALAAIPGHDNPHAHDHDHGSGHPHGGAAVAVRRDGRVSVLVTRAALALPTLVGLLGALTPGRDRPVNIPTRPLEQVRADQDRWALADDLVALGMPREDAHGLVRMCAGITRVAQFGVTRYDSGLERRGPWVLAVQRTGTGDHLQLRRGGTLTVAPVDTPRLLARLRELVTVTMAWTRESPDPPSPCGAGTW